MSDYAAEPVPANVDPALAEYLMRQMIGIQNALNTSGIMMQVSQLPRPIPGAIVHLYDKNDETPIEEPTGNGFYACVINSQGEGEWKKLQIQ